MSRTPDLACPATALTAEANVHRLGCEAVLDAGRAISDREIAAALRVALALMELSHRHGRDLPAGQGRR